MYLIKNFKMISKFEKKVAKISRYLFRKCNKRKTILSVIFVISSPKYITKSYQQVSGHLTGRHFLTEDRWVRPVLARRQMGASSSCQKSDECVQFLLDGVVTAVILNLSVICAQFYAQLFARWRCNGGRCVLVA